MHLHLRLVSFGGGLGDGLFRRPLLIHLCGDWTLDRKLGHEACGRSCITDHRPTSPVPATWHAVDRDVSAWRPVPLLFDKQDGRLIC